MKLHAVTPNDVSQLLALVNKNLAQPISMEVNVPDSLYKDVMQTTLWPEAAHPLSIVNDEPAKKLRASAIINSFIQEPLRDKKFLDFGCGDGHCVDEANRVGAKIAIGYDIANRSTSIDMVQDAAPYDVILVYDVLDHIIDDATRAEALLALKRWLKPGGNLYIRCHPFTSRHGCHNYYKFNKAYAQLLLSPEELAKYDPIPTARIVAPLATYRSWFQTAKLTTIKEQFRRTEAEEFFKAVSNQLMKAVSANSYIKDHQTLNAVLGIQFIDYILQ